MIFTENTVGFTHGKDYVAACIFRIQNHCRDRVADHHIFFDGEGRIIAAFLDWDNALGVVIQVDGDFRVGYTDHSHIEDIALAQNLKGTFQFVFVVFHTLFITHITHHTFLKMYGFIITVKCEETNNLYNISLYCLQLEILIF